MGRCVAVLGSSNVGKSELTDRMAMLEGQRPGKPPADSLRCVQFSFLGEDWTALDCPGSLEFAQTGMDALLAADAAVIVATPDPDHAVLAASWIRMAEQSGTPHLIFVNRMDECRSSAREIIEALQTYSIQPVILRQVPMRDGEKTVGVVDLVAERAWRYRTDGPSELIEIPPDLRDREAEGREELLESLSEHDDWLLEEIIEDRVPASGPVYGICARLLGSAANGHGVKRLMKALRHETPGPADTSKRHGGGDAVAFMSSTRKHVGRLVWLRNLGSELHSGSALGGGTVGGLVEPSGDRPGQVAALPQGGVASAVKTEQLEVGKIYDADGAAAKPDWHRPLPPLWRRAISAKHSKDEVKLSETLNKIAAEDLSLTVVHDQESGSIVLETLGAQHLRRVQRELVELFGVETEESPAPASYRETITRKADVHFRHKKQSGGAGQFADVKLTVEPAPRGDGFEFTESIHGGAVPRNYIPAVNHGAEDAMAKGPLGFPVIDVHVNLHDGLHHSVDSSDLAFRIAGRGAVTKGLAEAQPVLLEPIYEVRFQAPSVFTGALNPMISSQRGQILGFDRDDSAEGWDEVRALMPGAALEELINHLRSATQGVGRYSAEFANYQELYGREADEIVALRARESQK